MAEVENDRPDEWAYKYARPSAAKFVRWVNVGAAARVLIAQGSDPDTPREMFGPFIYSNTAGASCEYTQIISDTSLFPAKFRVALSAAIAGNVAMSITEDSKRAQFAMNEALSLLDEAIARDEQETPPIPYDSVPSWLSDRGVS